MSCLRVFAAKVLEWAKHPRDECVLWFFPNRSGLKHELDHGRHQGWVTDALASNTDLDRGAIMVATWRLWGKGSVNVCLRG